jgi:hypothetical protein
MCLLNRKPRPPQVRALLEGHPFLSFHRLYEAAAHTWATLLLSACSDNLQCAYRKRLNFEFQTVIIVIYDLEDGVGIDAKGDSKLR